MSRITDFFTINYSFNGGLQTFSQVVLSADWIDIGSGKFKLEFPRSLHAKTGHVVEIYEGTAKVDVDSIIVTDIGDVTITVTRRFNGKIVIG